MVYLLGVRHVCPKCGGNRVHHSRLRSWIERMRKAVTAQVPFRCHSCEWRGWRANGPPTTGEAPRPIHGDLTDAELDRLDVEGKRQ